LGRENEKQSLLAGQKETTIEQQNRTIAEQNKELDRLKSEVEKLRSEILERQEDAKQEEVMKGHMSPSKLSGRQHQGYIGLRLSPDPPHAVVEVDHLTDEKGVVQGLPGYANKPVQRGDILLSVDGKDTTGLSLDGIHGLLKGDLLTTVQLSLGRGEDCVCVKVMRHRFHEFEAESSLGFPGQMRNELEGLRIEKLCALAECNGAGRIPTQQAPDVHHVQLDDKSRLDLEALEVSCSVSLSVEGALFCDVAATATLHH
jgi:uncharacterized coiled-coil protein SlyX